MWNLITAELQDEGTGTSYEQVVIYPKNIHDFFVGDLKISSDEERAIKMILYQCEAQAHFYAHLAFSSTDGRSTVTADELNKLIKDPETAIRSAKTSSPSFSAALLQRNVENDIRYLVRCICSEFFDIAGMQV